MQIDAIWSRARIDLAITTAQGDPDCFLWEHSVRVANNARRIAGLPDAEAAAPDKPAVIAAALYHDAGVIPRLEVGEIRRDEILIRPLTQADRDQGARMLERSLTKLLPPDTLARAAHAVRTLHSRDVESSEGQVVADAENLDEFGVLSLWLTIRRGITEGKGVQAVIDTFHRRKEYRYWDVRLKNSFRFAQVRALAERRLLEFERLMQTVEEQHNGADFGFDGSAD